MTESLVTLGIYTRSRDKCDDEAAPIRTKMCEHSDTRQRNDCGRPTDCLAASFTHTTSVSDDRHNNNKPANRERHAQLIPVYKHATRPPNARMDCSSRAIHRQRRKLCACVACERVCSVRYSTRFNVYSLEYMPIDRLPLVLAPLLSGVCARARCVCVRVSHSPTDTAHNRG